MSASEETRIDAIEVALVVLVKSLYKAEKLDRDAFSIECARAIMAAHDRDQEPLAEQLRELLALFQQQFRAADGDSVPIPVCPTY